MATDQVFHWAWPRQARCDAWTVAFTWDPDFDTLALLGLGDIGELEALLDPDTLLDLLTDAGQGEIGDTKGLLYVEDSAGAMIAKVEYGLFATGLLGAPLDILDANLPGFRFTVGDQLVEIADLALGLGEPVRVRARFDATSGIALTVRTTTAGVLHETDPTATDPTATDPATPETYPAAVWLGLVSDGTEAGDGLAGDGNAGGVIFAGGFMEQFGVYEQRMDDAEAGASVLVASLLDALPTPEARLALYASLENTLEPFGSAYASGRRFEVTTDGGATRNPDENGLTKALAALDRRAVALPGLAVGLGGTGELLVYLATTDPSDDLADVHAQWAAASEQRVRIR